MGKNYKLRILVVMVLAIVALLPFSFSVSSIFIAAYGGGSIFTFKKKLIEPIENGSDCHISSSFDYRGDTLEGIIVRAEFYCEPVYEDIPYATTVIARNITLIDRATIIYSFDVPDAKYYAKYGIRINLQVKDSIENRILATSRMFVFTKTYDAIDIKDYTKRPYQIRNLSYTDGTLWNESFLFSGYDPYLYFKEYFYVNFDELYITYKGLDELLSGDCFIYFDDFNNIFPYIEKHNDGYKYIPFELSKDIDGYKIYFTSLYVKPLTLELATTQLEGFKSTHRLFLPKNKSNLLQGYSFVIYFASLGINEISAVHEVVLDFSRLLLGPCDAATYCITGGKA